MSLLTNYATNERNIWQELGDPVLVGIAAMSQLLISASRVSDFKINKIDSSKIPLVKHPESFRKTLTQIANDYYDAFNLAHRNMENIQLQMGPVPGNVKDFIEIIQRRPGYLHRILVYWGVKYSVNNDLLSRLEKMKIIADNGLKMSTEVSQAFYKIKQLIQQVLLAIIAASHGAKEKEIADSIDGNAERERFEKTVEEMYSRLEDNDRNRWLIQRIMQKKQQEKQGELETIQKYSGTENFPARLVAPLSSATRKAFAHGRLKSAEKDLTEYQREANQVEVEKDNIYEEFIKSFEQMHVGAKKDKSRDEMIQLVKEGMSQLSKLNSNWTGFTENFKLMNNIIEEVTRALNDSNVEDAQYSQEYGTRIIDFMTENMNISLKSSNKTHHTAKMYVEFSNNQITKSLNEMQRHKNALPSC